MKQKNLTDDLTSLPVWAQSEIKILQMRLRESKDECLRMKENPVSNTIVGHPYSVRDEKIQYLKENQMITFVFGESYVSARIIDDFVEISSQGDKDLFIRPKVSNVIHLHLK